LDRLAKSQDTPLTGSGILNPVLDGTTDQACRNFREWLEASAPDHDWPRPVAAIVHEAERCFAKLATADIRTTDQEGRRVE
jgi:hypothetical protein